MRIEELLHEVRQLRIDYAVHAQGCERDLVYMHGLLSQISQKVSRETEMKEKLDAISDALKDLALPAPTGRVGRQAGR